LHKQKQQTKTTTKKTTGVYNTFKTWWLANNQAETIATPGISGETIAVGGPNSIVTYTPVGPT
jgi:hypothetical protein